METKLTRESIEAQLQDKSRQISRRLNELGGEVTSAGSSLGKLAEPPLVCVGGSILAGLVVGLLFGGRRRNHGPNSRVPRSGAIRNSLGFAAKTVLGIALNRGAELLVERLKADNDASDARAARSQNGASSAEKPQ